MAEHGGTSAQSRGATGVLISMGTAGEDTETDPGQHGQAGGTGSSNGVALNRTPLLNSPSLMPLTP